MMQATINVKAPEVAENPPHARFYKDETQRAMVEITYIGSKDTLIQKVNPSHMARFREAWDAFCDGMPMKQREGTPLTKVVDQQAAERLVQSNVHTLEELAILNDMQCQNLGHGMITARHNARKALEAQAAEASKERRERVLEGLSKVGAAPVNEALNADMVEIKDALKGVSSTLEKLAELMIAQQLANAPAAIIKKLKGKDAVGPREEDDAS